MGHGLRYQFFASLALGFVCTAGVWLWISLDSGVELKESEHTFLGSRGGEERILIEGSRVLAGDSIDRLVRAHTTYIMVVREHGDTAPELWEGIERLSKYALLDRNERGVLVARRVLAILGEQTRFLAMPGLKEQLEEMIAAWEKRR